MKNSRRSIAGEGDCSSTLSPSLNTGSRRTRSNKASRIICTTVKALYTVAFPIQSHYRSLGARFIPGIVIYNIVDAGEPGLQGLHTLLGDVRIILFHTHRDQNIKPVHLSTVHCKSSDGAKFIATLRWPGSRGDELGLRRV